MAFLTRNILDFYKQNNDPQNLWYLEKNFTNTSNLGLYSPYAKNVVTNEWDGKTSDIRTIDEDNTYEINSLGFRGEVYESPEIIASGCSITFGLGVPELGRWTNILGNKINKNVMNLGNPGASVESICTHIIQYCMNNKMPKEIFCLFPDFFRSMVVVDKEFYKTKVKRDDAFKEKDSLQQIFCNPIVHKYDDRVFMEIEDQKYIEDATSPHQLILNSINFIYILESFCLANNIKLHWTTWHVPSATIMEELLKIKNFKLKNFADFVSAPDVNNTDFRSISFRCSSSHDSEFYDSIYWKRGTDYSIENYKKVSDHAHPGIHFQYHFADLFYKLHNMI
jgi:hypothetical protein